MAGTISASWKKDMPNLKKDLRVAWKPVAQLIPIR